jgi:hypothetical protein
MIKIEKNNLQIKNESDEASNLNDTLSKKFCDKDKLNKMLIDKINKIVDERKTALQEESEIRSEIVKKTEEYVKNVQQKYEAELPEKEKLIKENQELRQKIEEYVLESKGIKDSIENKLKSKENQVGLDEETFKLNIKVQMEEVTHTAQKNVLENMELKRQLDLYKMKYEEMSSNVKIYTDKYQEFIDEIEKV